MSATSYAARLGEDLGLDPEKLLHAYRDQVDTVHQASVRVARIKADIAALSAEHSSRGQNSHWDHARKALLAKLSEQRRAELLEKGEKVVEKALETEAHAHHDYLAFLDRGRIGLEEYEHRQADLSEAFADLERERGVLAYLEARLTVFKTLAYSWSAEVRLTPNQ